MSDEHDDALDNKRGPRGVTSRPRVELEVIHFFAAPSAVPENLLQPFMQIRGSIWGYEAG